MNWQWLTVCRDKDCGWDVASDSKVTADACRTKHERDRPGHRVVVVALEGTDALRTPPDQSQAA